MKTSSIRLTALFIIALLASCSKQEDKLPPILETEKSDKCIIGTQSIGKISIGQTVNDIKKLHPEIIIEKSIDGEGAEYNSYKYKNIVIFSDDNDNRGLDFLMVEGDSPCETIEGAKTGMTIASLEKIYGPAHSVHTNDANSNEEVIFSQQPKNLSFIGYGLGDFSKSNENSHETKIIIPTGMVTEIDISKHQ